MIKVFFDHGSHVELAATFSNEKLYRAALPVLEAEAKEVGATISKQGLKEYWGILLNKNT